MKLRYALVCRLYMTPVDRVGVVDCIRRAVLSVLFVTSAVQAGSIDGISYTNFGNDLIRPIFPVAGKLAVYKQKTDDKPRVTLLDKPVAEIEGDWRSCVKKGTDGWVHCTVEGETGWVKRADFLSGGEYAPVARWPFRWWFHVGSSGGGEEEDAVRKAAHKNPYLLAPKAFDNIFFHVLFDAEGRAIAPRTGKQTGDRVFLVGKAVYLAPENPARRNGATWLFLNFYNEQLNALCPAEHPDSCMSAVNLAPDWPGIKTLYEEPAARFRRKEKKPWFGASEVAFARHSDPFVPLIYRVPTSVPMKNDKNPITDAQLEKNREQPYCLADCPRGSRSTW